jgi:hypothetical protein
VNAHRITFTGGKSVVGLVENAEDPDPLLVVKDVKGRTRYPRDEIAKVESERVLARLVYTPEERYLLRVEQASPKSAEEHLELARWCMDIGAFAEAVHHFRQAEAEDELALAETMLEKADLLKELTELRNEGRREEALEKLGELREGGQLPSSVLDSLERQIRSRAERSYRKHPSILFWRLLREVLLAKIEDRDLTLIEARRWASSPEGLAAEVFLRIAAITDIPAKEARQIFDGRRNARVVRLNFGKGTFLHPDLLQAAGKPPPPGPQSGEGWWTGAETEDRKAFLLAWVAEFTGLLDVLRIDERRCKTCGGKGVLITLSAVDGHTIRKVCPTCNFVGIQRIVFCR